MPKAPVTDPAPIPALFIAALTVLLFISCDRPEIIHDLSSSSYELLNEDSTRVVYPSDFQGDIQVVSFMFTNCPDICPAITANMISIQRGLEDTAGIKFVEMTFDPKRDTPSVMKKHKNTFNLNEQFTMLTGDTASVRSILDELDIVARKVQPDSLEGDPDRYNMQHTNRILVMDEQGRVRFEYPGSYVRPEHVVEDIQKLR